MNRQALDIGSSRCFLVAGLSVHAMALAAVWLSALPLIWLAIANSTVLGSLWWFVTRQWRPAFNRLRPGDGVVRLSGPAGDLPVSPPVICFMACGVLLLRFRYRYAGQRQRWIHLLLLPDSLSPAHRRSLYRYLEGWSDELLTP